MGKNLCLKNNQGFILPFILVIMTMTMIFCLAYFKHKFYRLNNYVEYINESKLNRNEIEKAYQFYLGEENRDFYYDLHYICTYSTNHHFIIYEQDEIKCIRRCIHE